MTHMVHDSPTSFLAAMHAAIEHVERGSLSPGRRELMTTIHTARPVPHAATTAR